MLHYVLVLMLNPNILEMSEVYDLCHHQYGEIHIIFQLSHFLISVLFSILGKHFIFIINGL